MNLAMFGSFLLFRPPRASAQCKTGLFSASSRSVATLRRSAAAADGTQKSHRTGKKRACGKATALPFFHRLRPLTSITETDAQISGGETRQDLKIPGPGGSSCALLFLPFGLPVSFRCYGRVYLIPRLTLSSGKAVRSKLDCMHEPPFSPTAAPYPVTIVLSPTRKDMQKRHWQQPLVTDLEEIVLNLCAG